MKNSNLLLSALLLLSTSVFADLESTVPGISIGNAHLVDERSLIRGSQPLSKSMELKAWGITDVIIFKSPTRNEVADEITALTALGIRTTHIPFKWKNLESPEVACRQVVQALQIMKQNRSEGKVTFFHCTVGEDRTGLLAGVWRMLDDGYTRSHAWTNEMCPNGYADGNRMKPKAVAEAIHAELSPLFYGMAKKIKEGQLTLETLDAEVCKTLDIRPVTRRCR